MSAPQPKVLPKPVSWDELYPGRFLKASDFKGKQVTLRISAVNLEELASDDGGAKVKGVISFEKTDKMLALNRTNGICLKAMFGKKVQEWVGRQVTLFPTEVKAFGNIEDAIRVYGSPEIPRDLEVSVQLPRKKPLKMTMYRTAKSGAAAPVAAEQSSGATGSPPPPADAKTWSSTLNGATTREQLEEAWRGCTEAFGGMPPLECDSAYQLRREQLME